MRTTSGDDDAMRPEYDFSGGVRGKYAERYARRFGVNIVREGNGFVSLCPELDVASQGDTAQGARVNWKRRLNSSSAHPNQPVEFPTIELMNWSRS